MTPSACPVTTGSQVLDSRSKMSSPSRRGSPMSMSTARTRRLAPSVFAKPARPARSASLGRVRVSRQERQSGPGSPGPSIQLHSASRWLAQRRSSRSSSDPGSRVARSSREGTKPCGVPQRRQRLFSKKSSRPQWSQTKARTPRSYHGDVDLHRQRAARALGVDDAADRRHVAVVAPERGDDVAAVDELVVRRVDVEPARLGDAAPRTRRARRPRRRASAAREAGRSPGSRSRSGRGGRASAGIRCRRARSPGRPPCARRARPPASCRPPSRRARRRSPR